MLFLLTLNVIAILVWRSDQVAKERNSASAARWSERTKTVPPWDWSTQEWVETWPWGHKQPRTTWKTARGLRVAAELGKHMAGHAWPGPFGPRPKRQVNSPVFYIFYECDFMGTKSGLKHASEVKGTDYEEQGILVDDWGKPIRLRVPGPVHNYGWDAWSCGPNGIDEQGQGDDILVGAEDDQ